MATLLGFSDFFDEVGAVKKPGPKPAPKPTGGPKPQAGPAKPSSLSQKNVKLRSYGKVKQTTTVRKHGQVLGKAKQLLLKAARGIGKAQLSLGKKPATQATIAHAAAVKAATIKANTATAAARHAAAVQASPAATVAQKSAAAQRATAARGAASRAILGAVVTAVHARKPVVPIATKKLSPKAKAAITKHNAALAAAKQAAQKLAKQTLQTRKSVQALAKAAVNQKKVATTLRTKGRRTQIGAIIGSILTDPSMPPESVEEALRDYYTLLGAAPDPTNPGFLDDGSPDPAFFDTSTPMDAPLDPNTGMPTASSEPSLIDTGPALSDLLSEDAIEAIDNLNAAQGLPPMPPDQPTEADYKAVGGILYNESKGRPNGFVGSYGLMTRATSSDAPGVAVSGSDPGVNDYGYVWGSFDQDNVPSGTPWGGRLSENTFNHLHGRFVRGGSGSFNEPVPESEAWASSQKSAPNNVMYGPLIGNPGMPDFKGMRVDAQGNMFWYPQEAPDWLTAPLKQAAALTEAKIKKAAEDEQKQFALEEEKKRRDEQAQQAAQDAANALAESQAASEAAQAESASQAQQSQEAAAQAQQETAAQAQAQQEIISQAQAEQAEQAQAAAQESQAADILLQRAKRQEEYFAAHPDLEIALQAQAQGLIEPDEGEEAPIEEEAASAEGGDEGDEGGDEGYEGADFSEEGEDAADAEADLLTEGW